MLTQNTDTHMPVLMQTCVRFLDRLHYELKHIQNARLLYCIFRGTERERQRQGQTDRQTDKDKDRDRQREMPKSACIHRLACVM